MEREQKYIVIKLSDVDKMSYEDQLKLRFIARRVERQRSRDGKEPLKAVVVEHDWPEYEPTWKAIETRVEREESHRKFVSIFDDKERLGFFYVVETHQGRFLITSNAHHSSRLEGYSGYKYRALFSPDCGFDNSEIFFTNWGVHFKKVVQVSFEKLVSLYDPNKSISNYNVAEFIINKLGESEEPEF
ncbi:hypothetical protein Lw1_gp148 [Escherichia phage Lw1]|uniref:Phage protein n=1 Tax=Escherichia phage Lw1 TaxID=1307804 RepID=M9UXP7_9CAUD|nr:hypothetical protein Lw1_gp148 [Escherichia phage Lw1]AGJ71555.1 hypothetical protein Lw1_gp148 [Escherichia phage Lw1]